MVRGSHRKSMGLEIRPERTRRPTGDENGFQAASRDESNFQGQSHDSGCNLAQRPNRCSSDGKHLLLSGTRRKSRIVKFAIPSPKSQSKMSSSNTPDASIQSSREFTGSMISFSSQDAFGGQLPKRNRTASENCRTARQAVRRITEASNTTEFLADLHERSFHNSQRPQIGTLFYPINSGTSNDLSKKNQTTNEMEYSNSCAGDVREDTEEKISGESRPTTRFLRPPSGHKLTEANSKLRKSESSPLRKLALENRHQKKNAQLSGVRCLFGFDNVAVTIYQNPGSGNFSHEAWKIHDQKGGSYGSNNRNFDRFATSQMPPNGELGQDSYTRGREFQTWANFVKKVKLSNNPID